MTLRTSASRAILGCGVGWLRRGDEREGGRTESAARRSKCLTALGVATMAVKAKIKVLIDELLAWEILEPRNDDDSFVAVCKQLGLSVEAKDSNALISLAEAA